MSTFSDFLKNRGKSFQKNVVNTLKVMVHKPHLIRCGVPKVGNVYFEAHSKVPAYTQKLSILHTYRTYLFCCVAMGNDACHRGLNLPWSGHVCTHSTPGGGG